MSIPEWYQAHCWGLPGQIPGSGYGQRQHQKEDWCHLEAVQEVVHESTQKGGREKKGAGGTISSRCSDGKISKQTIQLINYKLSCHSEELFFSISNIICLSFQAYVRETCKASIDCQVPLTWQPEDKISVIIEQCVNQFPEICTHDLAKKKIGRFLKNCRKTEYRKSVGRKRPGQKSAGLATNSICSVSV